MLTWLVIALRHLCSNRRRSLATLLVVALGSAGVSILGGFTRYIFQTLEDAFVNARGNGHLQIVRRDGAGAEAMTPQPAASLLDRTEQLTIREVAARQPEVRLVTAQLTVTGLISNGRETAIFGAIGRVPSDYLKVRQQARGFLREAPLFMGQELDDGRPGDVGLSSGLADRLGLGLGSQAVVMAPTLAGRMNALDARAVQQFEAPSRTLNDKLLNVSLHFAQSLADTDRVDAMNLLLRGDFDLDRVRERLEQELREAGVAAEVLTWVASNPEYTKSREMFVVIFGFVLSVVIVIVMLSVLNTVGMAVLERTREIGTLRALGLSRRGVAAMFAAESGLLGVAGTLTGAVLTAGVRAGLRASGMTWSPPVYSGLIPLDFLLVPEYLIGNVFLFTALAMIAAILPARRAAHLPIPSALDHV